LKTVIGFLLISLLSSCSEFTVKDNLTKGYVLLSDSEVNGTSISFQLNNGDYIDVISNDVFAYGFSKDFIIAKQHPSILPKSSDKLITNYFIIPLKHTVSQFPDLNKIGPLNKEQFNDKIKVLKLPKYLTFKKVY